MFNSVSNKILGKESGLEEWLSIGMRDHITEGEWKTIESEYKCGVQFTGWAGNQPNNHGGNEDCAALRKSGSWKWYDVICDRTSQFLCQIFE